MKMNEKDAIIQKIISDAQDRAEKVVSDATVKVQSVWAVAQSESEKTLNACEKECDVFERELIERKKTLARLDGRKIVLNAKQNVVNSAFARAEKLLCEMPEDKQLKYVAARLEKYAKQGDKVVLAKSSPLSRESVEDLAVAKELLLKVTKNGDFKGGFILSGEVSDFDFTFESAVKSFAESYSGEIAREILN